MQVDLVNLIIKSRESTVEIDKFKFKIRRPTDVEALELFARGSKHVDMARAHVVGWEGFTEADIVRNGTTDVVEFDPAVWAEWIDDHPKYWVPLGDAIINAYQTHTNLREEAAKN